MAADKMVVGTITAPHGVRGEMKVYPLTDDMTRFGKLKTVYLQGEKRKVISVRYQNDLVLLKLEGLNSREEVERLKKCTLEIDRKDAVKPPEGRYFIVDLIGLTVRLEDGSVLGTLTDVLQPGGNDVYVVSREGKEDALIPAIRQVILKTDIQKGEMVIRPLRGLLDDED